MRRVLALGLSTWYYPVHICLSAPTSRRSASAHERTDSVREPLLLRDGPFSCAAAARDARSSRSNMKHKMRLTRAHFATPTPPVPEKRLASANFSLSLRVVEAHGGCAAVVSKKVAKLSVSRHLLKRRMLSVMRPWCSPTRALVIYTRPGAAALDFAALERELIDLLTRALPQIT